MKGKLISKTLAEAGVTPQDGMQVFWKEVVWNLILGSELALRSVKAGINYAPASYNELRILMVEYEDNLDKYVRNRDNPIVQAFSPHIVKYTLPLKLTDWQTVIDSGLVDSDKEVEWVNTREPAGSSNIVATLIPQQDDVEKLSKDWVKEHGTGYTGEAGFIAGYKADKYAQQQEIIKLQQEVVKLKQDIEQLNKVILGYEKAIIEDAYKQGRQLNQVDKLFEAWIESNPDIREHRPVTWGKLAFIAGHRAALALELHIKFAEWMAVNGIKVDGKKGDEITWMKYVEASHTNQGTTREIYTYWFNNVYKSE